MSLRTVRRLTPRRSANSAPGQVDRDCNRESRASRRAEVSNTVAVSVLIRNQVRLYGSYREAMTTNNSSAADIRPFRVDISQADLDDLHRRLANTRLPRPVPGDNWDLGTPNSYLRETVDYWQSGFDWR